MEDPILQYVGKKGQVTAGELVDNVDIPRSTLFTKLDQLVSQGLLVKIGNRPNVIYKLPEPAPVAQPAVNPIPVSTFNSAPESVLPAALQPGPVIFWCRILKLEPEAVRVSFQQIRQLVPNYQSIGLNPPKVKQVGLKVPDPIWAKFFNMLVWIMAIQWTMMKNVYALLRGRSTTPIVWRQMAIAVISLMLLAKLIVQIFSNPLTSSQYIQLRKGYEQILSELDRTKKELGHAKNQVSDMQQMLKDSPTQEQIDRLKYRLENEERLRKALEEEKKDWQMKRSALQAEENKRERLERSLLETEQEANARIEEWQRKERSYDKKQETAKAEIRELQAELDQSNQEARQLSRQLQREEAKSKELNEEIEMLKKITKP